MWQIAFSFIRVGRNIRLTGKKRTGAAARASGWGLLTSGSKRHGCCVPTDSGAATCRAGQQSEYPNVVGSANEKQITRADLLRIAPPWVQKNGNRPQSMAITRNVARRSSTIAISRAISSSASYDWIILVRAINEESPAVLAGGFLIPAP